MTTQEAARKPAEKAVRDFRFGINMDATVSRKAWQDGARDAEDQGFDVILVPDHLDMGAPVPALMSAAAATSRVRLSTIVLNSGFYRPALLARDAAALHEFTDGRLELGIGAGSEFAAQEFAVAELPFPSARERVDHLQHMVLELRRIVDADQQVANQPPMPIMVAGLGNRVLGLAARHADIVNIAAIKSPPGQDPARFDPLLDRVEVIRAAAGDRFADIELSLHVPVVHITGTGEPDLRLPSRANPGLSRDDLLALPGVLHGSPAQVVEQLHRYRDECSITYFITDDLGTNRRSLATVIDQLR